ncbi:MAG: DoxX family protein [Chitinophagaceae bacterium]|jgi:uncharacterized membrane protein YphA (DoxX/SURF4 family)|nr:DoxX family protein [Chitinophagaceae bacterium]MBP6045650.1 DoxX family protein [Ferruginibacter sp.]MBK7087988.1 DoxX family protein [Chitinophagaceae bacterium]MBK7735344.1 DoxX family protein [Chitinophagaceae bacterium]MBK8773250.1 DoxX family protein [Chitinophagaceae bacterium]
MKTLITIVRFIVGALFIFSGLVKAIDPLGLAYKMQEFFEAWASGGLLPGLLNSLNAQALPFSITMITLEVVVGIGLIIGWQKKFFSWILLLLVVFFTFLTGYVLFSGKIRACGCFGDCIPLTPIQTFTKDIILFILALFLLFRQKYIRPLAKPYIAGSIAVLAALLTLLLQWYVLRHLPVKDCLPFKPGNNILELRKMPADAIPDKFDYVFIYSKNGEKKEFTVNALPDSTWTYADRKQILIQRGKNNIPLINDFSFGTASGTDTTDAILGQPGEYYLLFIQNVKNYPVNWDEDKKVLEKIQQKSKSVYLVTSGRGDVEKRFPGETVFTCDFTAIKTAARSNPTLYRMNGPVIMQKWGWADFSKIE